MKRMTGFLVAFALLLLFCATGSAGQVPRQIAGIVLGAQIDQYKDLIREDSTLPIRHMEYISEVETKPIAGYKSGYIFYGNCEHPGRIVKVKLKYLREDKEFFDQLLEQFKQKFGKASEYKGDPFGGFIAWKWSFRDQNKDRISLILQRNSVGEEEYTSGNSLKLAITSAMEQERKCYEKKYPEREGDTGEATRKTLKSAEDFKQFIPE